MALIIPIFLAHEGCPFRCIFCNQQSISGRSTPPTNEAEVRETIRTWLEQCRPDNRGDVQVAFYGGSFTGLPRQRQEALLVAVAPFIDQGLVHAIRLSTRPDYIDQPRLELLIRHRVSIVELGVQSCDDRVLMRSGRGHNRADIQRAAGLVRQSGLRLGIQLMTGLPGDTFTSLRATVAEVIRLQPEFVRIYPVVVLRGSALEALYRRGKYHPLSLGKAVLLTAWMKKRFDGHGIGVVRMGLQPTPELTRSLVAGPFHPAFGELVKSRLMLGQVRRTLAAVPAGTAVRLMISDRDQSLFRGQNKANIRRLRQLGLNDRYTLHTDPLQSRLTLRVIAPESSAKT